MKQTAVEWLEKELKLNLKKIILQGDYELMESLFEQAKQIEKQQMKDAVLEQATKHEGLRKIFDKQFEQYYNETFNK